jgi:DNA modification methylase
VTPSWRILEGDALERLADLADESVQCVVTSPPYWGLRDYGVDGQIGLEASPHEFVDALVGVFREVRRVLRPDGTVWLNLGDSYAAKSRGSDAGWDKSRISNPGTQQKAQAAALRRTGERHRGKSSGVKEKDLIGMPWMVAFALRADGWYLRQEVIWHKRSPMPESVSDRCTRAHEQVFMLTKAPRYFYDADAIAEPAVSEKPSGNSYVRPARLSIGGRGQPHPWTDIGGQRNRRSVWTLSSEPFAEAHFATFPPGLVEPCILAGTSERACGACCAPWRRVVEVAGEPKTREGRPLLEAASQVPGASPDLRRHGGHHGSNLRERKTLGWEPTCAHDDPSGHCVVLDPFAGAGTTLMVALRRGRSAIGVELNPEYSALARRRIVDDAPLFNAAAEEAVA